VVRPAAAAAAAGPSSPHSGPGRPPPAGPTPQRPLLRCLLLTPCLVACSCSIALFWRRSHAAAPSTMCLRWDVTATVAPSTVQSAALSPPLLLNPVLPLPLLPCVQPNAAKYYTQRASEGGLLISEGTVISERGHGYPCTPVGPPWQQADAAAATPMPSTSPPQCMPCVRHPAPCNAAVTAACRCACCSANRQPPCAWCLPAGHLHAGAGGGVEAHRQRCARQGRQVLLPNLACRPRLAPS
jgi:hypothetical protein